MRYPLLIVTVRAFEREQRGWRRLGCGVARLDDLLGGGLLEHSATLVVGAPGTGKSLLGHHFVMEGAHRGEPGLLVCLEERAQQVIRGADKLELPLGQLVQRGIVEVVFLPGELVHTERLLPFLRDSIRRRAVARLVIDSVDSLLPDPFVPSKLALPLKNLITDIEQLGVTSVLTMGASRPLDETTREVQDIVAIAGRIIVLGYCEATGTLQRTLSIVTRDNPSGSQAYPYAIGRGGFRLDAIAEPLAAAKPVAPAHAEPVHTPPSRRAL